MSADRKAARLLEIGVDVNGSHGDLGSLPHGSDRLGVFGLDAIEYLPHYVHERGITRTLLVTGKTSFDLSGAARIVAKLEKHTLLARWSEFEPNTSAADVSCGLAVLHEFQPDVIVGVGGGSVMDMAKLLCAFDGVSEAGDLNNRIKSGYRPGRRLRQLILAPTTAGSGSEATHFAVVYVGERKYSVASPELHPDFVVIDPALAVTGSAYQKATSGIDAVSQAIESIWAAGATARSREFAVHALHLLVPALPAWVSGNNDVVENVSAGSHLAGRAIDLSKTTGPHAMAYGITKHFGVSHGHAVALTMRAFAFAHVVARADCLQPGLPLATHMAAMQTLAAALGLDQPSHVADWFEEFCASIGLQLGLSGQGITEDALVELAQHVNAERLSNNPLAMSEQDLHRLLKASL